MGVGEGCGVWIAGWLLDTMENGGFLKRYAVMLLRWVVVGGLEEEEKVDRTGGPTPDPYSQTNCTWVLQTTHRLLPSISTMFMLYPMLPHAST